MHHESQNSPACVGTIHEVTRRQVTAIANMARKLKNTPDPSNGTNMLDGTVIVYIGDNGEQHHSTATEFPILLIGGRAMHLQTGGRTIVYPGIGAGNNHRQVSNLWNTLGQLTGAMQATLPTGTNISFDVFGGEGPNRIAHGPLSELMM
jgi:hypothetical protein